VKLYLHSPYAFMAWCFIKHRDNCTNKKVTTPRLITSEIKYCFCLRHKGIQGEKKCSCTHPSTLGANEWSASRHRRFTPGEKPDTHRIAGFVGSRSQSGRFGETKIPSPFLEFKPRTVQLITQSRLHVQESSQV